MKKCVLLFLCSTGLGSAAAAQEPPSKGTLAPKVVTVLESVAKGKCPEDLMAPVLLDACQRQLDVMQPRLASHGMIKEARYRGIEHLPDGTDAEAYKVIFEKGFMSWVAAAGANGKLVVLWSPS